MGIDIRRFFVFALALGLVLVFNGCDGSGRKTQGRATVSIQWDKAGRATHPSTSRLIPQATQSIEVVLSNGATVIARQVVARPAGANSSTVTFNALAPALLTVTAKAYASSDASGAPLAFSSSTLQITSGQTATITLTLASTIDHMQLSYNQPTLSVGQTTAVTVTAYDSNGNIVLVTPGALTWSASPSGVLSIATTSTGANLTGMGAGTTTVTVTDSESGKSQTFNVVGMTFTLNVTAPTLGVNSAYAFVATVAGPADTSVTWSVRESNGGTISGAGNYTAPALPGTYHIKVVSNADPSQIKIIPVTVQAGDAAINIQ